MAVAHVVEHDDEDIGRAFWRLNRQHRRPIGRRILVVLANLAGEGGPGDGQDRSIEFGGLRCRGRLGFPAAGHCWQREARCGQGCAGHQHTPAAEAAIGARGNILVLRLEIVAHSLPP
jgi:hypothetical protein